MLISMDLWHLFAQFRGLMFPPDRCRFWGGIVLIALISSGCSRSPQAPAPASSNPAEAARPPVQGDWVVQRIDNDLDTLNPLTIESANGQTVSSQINEGLLQMNNYTLKLEPCLAESYEISPDQLTYTFHLRHGVRWQDGEPFTADDVKYTYDRLQDPKVDAASTRTYFTNIKSCEVLDPYTVRFTATERYFKSLEVIGGLAIIPKHVLEKGEPDFNKHPFGRHPIGTGPYKFVRWDTGQQIVLERNDDYWGGPIHYPKRLVYEIIEEPYVAAQLIKKGEIDLFDKVTPIQWEHELKDSRSMDRLREIVYPFPAYYYLGFNLRLPMFSDIRVRHAIDLLMPRDEIIKQVYLGQYADKTSGYDPPSSRNYNHDVAPTPYDPAQALQLLTQAGWKNDHGDGILYKDGQPLSFTLSYGSGNPNIEKMAELIQESLRRAGIDLKLSRLAFAQLIERADDWKFDASLQGWALDLNGDPSQLWDSSQADIKKSSNFIGYKDPAADKLIAAGKLEYDDEKRAAIYRQLQQIIHDDYPVCFLINPRQILIVSDRFQNIRMFAPRPCFDIMTWWVPRDRQKYGN
jgi:peptide/nickel transport system substrate-binding protein